MLFAADEELLLMDPPLSSKVGTFIRRPIFSRRLGPGTCTALKLKFLAFGEVCIPNSSLHYALARGSGVVAGEVSKGQTGGSGSRWPSK